MDSVKNKIVIITGGAVGIGKSANCLLAREGAKIASTDINAVNGQKHSCVGCDSRVLVHGYHKRKSC